MSSGDSPELKELKDSLQDTQPVGSIISKVRTLDQAKAVLTFVEAAAQKTLRTTVALTAGRGRGKSAALGLSLAAAIAYGCSRALARHVSRCLPVPARLNPQASLHLSPLSTLSLPSPLAHTLLSEHKWPHHVVRHSCIARLPGRRCAGGERVLERWCDV